MIQSSGGVSGIFSSEDDSYSLQILNFSFRFLIDKEVECAD